MAQLWGGRFTKETDQLVYNFNASISFDQKFFKEDSQKKAGACQLYQAEKGRYWQSIPCQTDVDQQKDT